jgi:hypothetical protein
MQVLNKYDKEQLVVELYQGGKTMREIASAVHMSFGDIGKIIKRIDGRANDIDISNKSKAAQAMYLFKTGKKPIDVAIELDIPANEIEDILQEYWVLIQLDELALVYYEIRSHLDLFLKLFHTLKKNRLINQKDIQTTLKYTAFDLPFLESKIQRLTSDAIELEWKKKQSRDEVAILNSSISQLKKSLNWYKMEIEQKKQIILNLNQQLNQKSNALEEKLLSNNTTNSDVP